MIGRSKNEVIGIKKITIRKYSILETRKVWDTKKKTRNENNDGRNREKALESIET